MNQITMSHRMRNAFGETKYLLFPATLIFLIFASSVTAGDALDNRSIIKPEWASDGGKDQYGSWADLTIGGVTQRFRWIAPGTFTMGSPQSEKDASLASVPGSKSEWFSLEVQHKVRLTRGYWLADSTCTQELWQSVTGLNPSFFKDAPRNPVEQVSWDDCQQFIATLNGKVPGGGFGLPTEAQWEYACRAGTTTAFSFGTTITTDQVNYNGDYPFDGETKTLNRQKTLPVKSLPPNPWGLYEMHGNVDQWCSDWYGEYFPGTISDPIGLTSGSHRVVRGGTWYIAARSCRSSFRFGYSPGDRDKGLGFRLSKESQTDDERLQARLLLWTFRQTKMQEAFERAQSLGNDISKPVTLRRKEWQEFLRTFSQENPYSQEDRQLRQRARQSLVELGVEPEAVQTNSEMAAVTDQPAWATDSGTDQFGSWADLVVAGVTQRFRLITPGTFTMGSPTEEKGAAVDPQEDRVWIAREVSHQVTLTKGYWLADTACTQSLWQVVTSLNPSHFKESPLNPVEQVSWNDCQSFLTKLNGRVTGGVFGLPTEAQWEYACRAGTTTAFSFGSTITPEQVNYNGDFPFGGTAKGHNRQRTVPVKSLPPNPWGLYEMHGNVWQWCSDWYGNYTDEVFDPTGPLSGVGRVMRGGSWYKGARSCRSACRGISTPNGVGKVLGFRICARASEISVDPTRSLEYWNSFRKMMSTLRAQVKDQAPLSPSPEIAYSKLKLYCQRLSGVIPQLNPSGVDLKILQYCREDVSMQLDVYTLISELGPPKNEEEKKGSTLIIMYILAENAPREKLHEEQFKVLSADVKRRLNIQLYNNTSGLPEDKKNANHDGLSPGR